jgi:hypothetical protein
MYTDDYLSREIRDILSRKPDATHKEIVQALTYRARLKWGRIPPAVQLWQRGLDSADDITRKYRPDQPRVPEGSSEGGEWTRDPNSSEGGRVAREAARPKARAANTSEGGREARLEARNKALLREVSRPGSKYDVLKNPDGNFVYGPTGELVKFPKEYPPSFFINEGEKNNIWRLVRTKPTADLAGFTLINEITKFGVNGKWDIQRRFNETSGPMDHSLRDYSTIAIGLYAYGAGIHPWLMNYLEASYAYINGNQYDKAEPKGPLNYLPQRNAENTYIGYELGGRISDKR